MTTQMQRQAVPHRASDGARPLGIEATRYVGMVIGVAHKNGNTSVQQVENRMSANNGRARKQTIRIYADGHVDLQGDGHVRITQGNDYDGDYVQYETAWRDPTTHIGDGETARQWNEHL